MSHVQPLIREREGRPRIRTRQLRPEVERAISFLKCVAAARSSANVRERDWSGSDHLDRCSERRCNRHCRDMGRGTRCCGKVESLRSRVISLCQNKARHFRFANQLQPFSDELVDVRLLDTRSARARAGEIAETVTYDADAGWSRC
jgi:hypothetical protein